MLFLNLLILSISLNNLQSWVVEKDFFKPKFLFDYIQVPWIFMAMPFLYMFLIYYLNIEKKSFNILKITIPLFFSIMLAQVIFVIRNTGIHAEENLKFMYEKYIAIEEIVTFLTSISLFFYCFFILLRKEELFKKIQSFDNLKWLNSFFKLTLVGYLLWLGALIFTVSLNFTSFIFSYYPLRIYTTVLIYWLGYQSISQLRILKERKKIRKKIHEKKLFTLTSSKNNTKLSQEVLLKKHKEQFDNIHDFICENAKYLESKYTLQNLSTDTKIGLSTLSLIINNFAGKSFTEYINEMRIGQAKSFLLNPDYSEYTITSIGLESGFNSKSTFYTVFKKHTGVTPFEFKNSISTTP